MDLLLQFCTGLVDHPGVAWADQNEQVGTGGGGTVLGGSGMCTLHWSSRESGEQIP